MKLIIQNHIDDLFQKNKYTNYTEIQKQSIQKILTKQDFLWLAETWSWKTLAFWIPLLENISNNKGKNIQWLILAPTRELVSQIYDELKFLSNESNIRISIITGGVHEIKQTKELQKKPNIIIATPWRLLDLANRNEIELSKLEYLVLDEADKMLDMGFFPDIKKIKSYIQWEYQKILFSATQSQEIKIITDELLDNPNIVEIGKKNVSSDNISEYAIKVDQNKKPQALQEYLSSNQHHTCVIFVKTKDSTEEVLSYLQWLWLKASHIHRNRSQNARKKALEQLKNREINYLVATDILSRGIDIEKLDCVINYDIPKENETYIHRIWRTWRAWEKWIAITFYTEQQTEKLEQIQKLTGKSISLMSLEWYQNKEIIKPVFSMSFNLNEEQTTIKKKKKRYYKKKK